MFWLDVRLIYSAETLFITVCHRQCEHHSTSSNVQLETPYLTEGVKSFVTPRRERFMCAVKPFEVNCILLSFCACNILCSSLYGDRGGRSLAPSLSRSYSSSFVPLCVQCHRANTSSHLSLNAACVSPGSGHYI